MIASLQGIDGEPAGAVAFAGGYVVWGISRPGDDSLQTRLTTWYSRDGKTWEKRVLAEQMAGCAGPSYPDIYSAGGAITDGRTVVIVAAATVPAAAGVCPARSRAVAISTTDGLSWRRATFGPTAEILAPASAYRADGGWDVLVSIGSGKAELWHSTDAATWSRLGVSPAADMPSGAAGTPTGRTRLLATSASDREGQLYASADGVSWQPVATLKPGETLLGSPLAPAAAGSPWLVALYNDHDPAAGAKILYSADLRTWKRATFPRPYIAAILAEPWGWTAIGVTPYDCTGGPCDPPGPPDRLYKSVDAQVWAEWGGNVPTVQTPPMWSAQPLFVEKPEGQPGTLYQLVTR